MLAKDGKGGIRTGSLEELVEFAKQRRESEQELGDLYRKGALPLHFILSRLNGNFADLYHQRLMRNLNFSTPKKKFPLRIRYGGRGFLRGFPDKKPNWRLNVDLTSLLLAHHFGLLDKVEKSFAPIRLPSALIPALAKLRDDCQVPNPSRVESCRKIIQQVDNKSIGIVHLNSILHTTVNGMSQDTSQLLAFAVSSKGYLVAFCPLRVPPT